MAYGIDSNRPDLMANELATHHRLLQELQAENLNLKKEIEKQKCRAEVAEKRYDQFATSLRSSAYKILKALKE